MLRRNDSSHDELSYSMSRGSVLTGRRIIVYRVSRRILQQRPGKLMHVHNERLLHARRDFSVNLSSRQVFQRLLDQLHIDICRLFWFCGG